MEIINRNDVKAFITKDGSEIREILAPRNSSIQRQSLAEALLQPGQANEEHTHPNTEEIYYILSGCGRMKIEGEERDIKPFDGITIPPGASHQTRNTGGEPLIFLCCCVPAYTDEDTVMSNEKRVTSNETAL